MNDINPKQITSDLEKYDLERLSDGKYLFNSKEFNPDVDLLNRDINQYIIERELKDKNILEKKTIKTNDEISNETIIKPVYEYSIGEIAINTKNTLFNILNDLLAFNFNANIFIKENRIFYLGICFIFISLMILLFSYIVSD